MLFVDLILCEVLIINCGGVVLDYWDLLVWLRVISCRYERFSFDWYFGFVEVWVLRVIVVGGL